MKLLGLIALLIGLTKLCLSWTIKEESLDDYVITTTKEGKSLYKYLTGFIIIDGLVELICGLFLMFL